MISISSLLESVKASDLVPGDTLWESSGKGEWCLLDITIVESAMNQRVRVMGPSWLRTFDEEELVQRISK